jgi:hypothetical protein
LPGHKADKFFEETPSSCEPTPSPATQCPFSACTCDLVTTSFLYPLPCGLNQMALSRHGLFSCGVCTSSSRKMWGDSQ